MQHEENKSEQCMRRNNHLMIEKGGKNYASTLDVASTHKNICDNNWLPVLYSDSKRTDCTSTLTDILA